MIWSFHRALASIFRRGDSGFFWFTVSMSIKLRPHASSFALGMGRAEG